MTRKPEWKTWHFPPGLAVAALLMLAMSVPALGDEPGPVSGGTDQSYLGRVTDSVTDAFRGLLNPMPDREGPCPGGREVVDKFGRKRCVSDAGSPNQADAGSSLAAGGSDAGSERGLVGQAIDSIGDALSALLNPMPDREGPCPGGREVTDKFGRKRCVSDSDQKSASEETSSTAEGKAGATSDKGIFAEMVDSIGDALSALLNPTPDREGPCPGGREVTDKFGRKRCVSDSSEKSASEETSSTAEGKADATSDKGFLEQVVDSIGDALSALLNPTPDREGPCPGGREVVDKFGRKKCVSDSDEKSASEDSDSPSEGKVSGSSDKGVLEQVVDSIGDALSALLNPMPDREGPCPGGREVTDKYGVRRCVSESSPNSPSEDMDSTSEGKVSGSSEKGLLGQITDSIGDALNALLNPMPDREGPCPGGREVTDKYGVKRCVSDSSTKSNQEDTAAKSGGSDAAGSEGTLGSDADGDTGTQEGEEGFFDQMSSKFKEALSFLLNPLPDRKDPCREGRLVVDKYGRKRCVGNASSQSRDEEGPATPLNDAGTKPSGDAEYRADDAKELEPDEGSDANPKSDEGAVPESGDASVQQPGLFERIKSSMSDALAFLMNPMPDREGPCAGGRQVVDQYGRKRCVTER